MRVFLSNDDVGRGDGDDDKVTDCCPDAYFTQMPRDLDSSPTSSADVTSDRWSAPSAVSPHLENKWIGLNFSPSILGVS